MGKNNIIRMKYQALCSWANSTKHKLLHIREELALWQARRMAEQAFKEQGVRQFVLPTPEGVLRVLSWAEARDLREQGYFPRRFKVRDLYTMSLWWTAASRHVVHGNSLPKRYVNRESLYRWWYMTHAK